MAYLDNYLQAARNARLGTHKAIVTGERRKHVISKVMDLLDDFRLSHWEHEGAARSGLRSSLCSLGHGWSVSDQEAATIVATSLRKIGAPPRPTWLEGQLGYTTPREQCVYCTTSLSEFQITRGERFCGPECARFAIERNAHRTNVKGDIIGRAAWRILAQAKTSERTCQQCAVGYHPVREGSDQKFCSHRCRAAAARTIPDRECLHCGITFRPEKINRVHCSSKCASVRRFKNAVIEKDCLSCGKPFTAKISTAMYCCEVCKKRAFRSRQKKSNVIYLTPQIFDGWFREAA